MDGPENRSVSVQKTTQTYHDRCVYRLVRMVQTHDEDHFLNPSLANYINSYYYPVRFNAESKDTIEFLDKKYINKNIGNRSANDLAVEMLEGKLSYPTTVFYNNNYKFKMLAPGYMKEKDIEPILVYTVE